jgi:hypothetical protein
MKGISTCDGIPLHVDTYELCSGITNIPTSIPGRETIRYTPPTAATIMTQMATAAPTTTPTPAPSSAGIDTASVMGALFLVVASAALSINFKRSPIAVVQ